MSYIYIQSEPACWTVGFYDPDGEWQSESDHSKEHLAAERVAYLNGGGDALELRGAIKQLKERVTMLEMGMNAAMRQAIAAARAVIEQLPVADDPFMPPDEFWQWMPEVQCVAVDSGSALFWYDADIEAGTVAWSTSGISLMDANFGCLGYRDLGDTDWRTTKRTRPSHL